MVNFSHKIILCFMRVFRFLLIFSVLPISPTLLAQFHRVESVVKVGDPERYHTGYSAKLLKDGKLLIEPNSRLYDIYNHSESYEVPLDYGYGSYSHKVGELSLILYVVNNTKHPVDISNLKIDVTESRLDTHPYVSVYTDLTNPLELIFFNEGWSRWERATVLIDIQGRYDEVTLTEEIKYFDGEYVLNLSDAVFEMVEMRHKISKIEWKSLLKILNDYNLDLDSEYQDRSIFDDVFGHSDFVPYAGVFTIDDKYFIRISGLLPLFEREIAVGASAYKSYAGQYTVVLNADGVNYSTDIPYMTYLPAGGTEWVILKIKCDKTSVHDLAIKVCDFDGNVLSKTDIELHYYEPWRLGKKR